MGFLQIVSAEQTLVYYAALDLLAENQTTGDCGTCDVHSDCVRGRCVLRHAWFHHALSPALEFVRNGYVYFDQAPETRTQPGAMFWGLPPAVTRHVWVESFWDATGGRSAQTASNAETAWAVIVAIVVLFGTAGVEAARRRIVRRWTL